MAETPMDKDVQRNNELSSALASSSSSGNGREGPLLTSSSYSCSSSSLAAAAAPLLGLPEATTALLPDSSATLLTRIVEAQPEQAHEADSNATTTSSFRLFMPQAEGAVDGTELGSLHSSLGSSLPHSTWMGAAAAQAAARGAARAVEEGGGGGGGGRQTSHTLPELVGHPVEVDSAVVRMTTRGFAWLPADLVFERVRSRAINATGALMLFFLLASYQVMRNDSFGKCFQARQVADCDLSPVATDGTKETYTVFAVCVGVVIIGLTNSMYFMRGSYSGEKCWWISKFLSLCIAVALLVEAIYDLWRCQGPTKFEPFCGDLSDPLAKHFVQEFQDSIDESSIQQKAMLLLGSLDPCVTIVNSTTRQDCEATGETAAGLCSPDLMMCTCSRVHRCFKGFWTQPTTVTRSSLWFVLVLALVIALIWDVVLRARSSFVQRRDFFTVADIQVFEIPYMAHRLGRRVPMALAFAWMLNLIWTVDEYASTLKPTLELLDLNDAGDLVGIKHLEAVRDALKATALLFVVLQLAVFSVAVLVNLRTYWRDSDLLASLDWNEYLHHDSVVHAPEGWTGPDLVRFRRAHRGRASWYFGASWASLHLGSIVFSAFLALLVGLAVALIKIQELRPIIWKYGFSKVAISFIAYVATIAGQRATRRCLWGRAGQFPKRVGCAVFFDLYHSVTGLVASIFTAALRFLKSAISSMIWLMSVTSPGAHEINCLTDNMHGYYLEVLWQERFKLEVDMGKVDVREPDVGRRKECADCSRCCCETCGTTCLAILVVFFVALWFENGDVGTVVAWLADAGADKLPDS